MKTDSTVDSGIKLANIVARAPRLAALRAELEALSSELPESCSRILACSASTLGAFAEEAAFAAAALRDGGDDAPDLFDALVSGHIELLASEAA